MLLKTLMPYEYMLHKTFTLCLDIFFLFVIISGLKQALILWTEQWLKLFIEKN
jgi:hypothetical protein